MPRFFVVSTFLLASIIGAPVQAGSVMVWAHDSERNLYTIDVATREASFVSRTPVVLFDIAFDPSGELFGVGEQGTLYSINPPTGELTLIGNLGARTNSLVFGLDGSLWSAGRNALYSVDPDTGTSELAVNLSPFDSAGDLAFDSLGNLLVSTTQGSLVRIDTTAQTFDVVGELGFEDVFGLARAPDGTMFGITSGNQLLSVDTNTGFATELGGITAQGFVLGATGGSSFATEAVPEPSTMILVAFGLAGIASRKLRFS